MFPPTTGIGGNKPPRQILETTVRNPSGTEGADGASETAVLHGSFGSGRPAMARRRQDHTPVTRLAPSKSSVINQILTEIDQVASTPATVLLQGETGVGKEVFAFTIHDRSPRRDRPMIRVNCGAIPATLIESEFFGHERGAYTGAVSRQVGRFEAAHKSTLLLDEIGDLPPLAQVKLLRVLQDGVIERLGSSQPIKVDVRIIAATNTDLEQAVANGTFREDLFYRLNVFPIAIPPLRERAEDIPALVWEFVNELSQTLRKPVQAISAESMREMQRYGWPGNVRELRNAVERAMIVATGPTLSVQIAPPLRAATSRPARPAVSTRAS